MRWRWRCRTSSWARLAELWTWPPAGKCWTSLTSSTSSWMSVTECWWEKLKLLMLVEEFLQWYVCTKAEVGMRRDVQTIFKATPHEKQVMMYSATLDKEIRPICRKFCQDVRIFGTRSSICKCYLFPSKILTWFSQPMEIFVDDDTKLTLHGLQQYYIRLEETEKNKKLNDLLDLLDFNQVRMRRLVFLVTI